MTQQLAEQILNYIKTGVTIAGNQMPELTQEFISFTIFESIIHILQNIAIAGIPFIIWKICASWQTFCQDRYDICKKQKDSLPVLSESATLAERYDARRYQLHKDEEASKETLVQVKILRTGLLLLSACIVGFNSSTSFTTIGKAIYAPKILIAEKMTELLKTTKNQ